MFRASRLQAPLHAEMITEVVGCIAFRRVCKQSVSSWQLCAQELLPDSSRHVLKQLLHATAGCFQAEYVLQGQQGEHVMEQRLMYVMDAAAPILCHSSEVTLAPHGERIAQMFCSSAQLSC